MTRDLSKQSLRGSARYKGEAYKRFLEADMAVLEA